jgi:hypothetical protein
MNLPALMKAYFVQWVASSGRLCSELLHFCCICPPRDIELVASAVGDTAGTDLDRRRFGRILPLGA